MKPRMHTCRSFQSIGITLISGIAAFSSAQAGTKLWNTTSGSLSGSTSWSPTGTPVTTDETLFDGTVTPAASISSAAGSNSNFGNLIWNNNTSSTLQMNTTSNTNAVIRLTGGGGFTAAIAAGGASGDLFVMGSSALDNILTVSSVNINAAPGTAQLRFRLDNSGNFNVVNAGAHLSIGTAIGESGGTQTLTKTGAGRLTLGAANTFTGGVVLNSGSLGIGSSSALGTGGLTINGGRLGATGASSRTITNNVTVNSDFILGGLGQALTMNGTMDLGGGNRTITLNNTATIGGVVSNGSLTKSGNSPLTLKGANTYGGATTVSQGTLAIDTTGTINDSSGITINGGNFRYNSTTDLTPSVTFTGGTLSGTNWNGTLSGQTIGSGQTISPGNSPGTASTGAQTWASGGSYLWEINDATGTAGTDPGWDLENGTGTLDITATSGSQFNLLVTSLTSANAAGLAANFSDALNYSWLIADFNAITGFAANAFNINTSAFTNSFTGVFGVSLGGVGLVPGDTTQIYLTYTAIPEPAAILLGGLGLLALLRRQRI